MPNMITVRAAEVRPGDVLGVSFAAPDGTVIFGGVVTAAERYPDGKVRVTTEAGPRSPV